MIHSILLNFQDVGYGSVRSRASEASDNSRNLESIDWGSPQKGDTSEIRIPVPEKVGWQRIGMCWGIIFSSLFFPLFLSVLSWYLFIYYVFFRRTVHFLSNYNFRLMLDVWLRSIVVISPTDRQHYICRWDIFFFFHERFI